MSLLLACAFLERLTSLWQFPYFFLAKKEKKMREIVPRRGGKGGGDRLAKKNQREMISLS